MFLRDHLFSSSVHELYASHLGGGTAMTAPQTVLLVISFAVLVAVLIYSLNYALIDRFQIPISPSYKQERAILIAVVVVLGGVGIYGLFTGSWGNATWIYYSVCNFLLGAFVFVYYHINHRYILIFSVVIMVCLAIEVELLAHSVANSNPSLDLLISLVGAVVGWAYIWTLYVIGQMMVYDCSVSRKSQTICFFVAALIVIVLEIIGKRYSTGSNWLSFIGFIVTTIALTVLMYLRQEKSCWT
jgi:hypothetical protein